MMPFSHDVKEEALVRSRRCCCICNEFSGLYTNVHHIVPESANGDNGIDNAIVLCLRCHGEVGHYNTEHPIGNKYTVSELKKHRDNWWTWCKDNPSVPLPKDPISISPSRIQLGTGEWRTKTLISLYNKTERFYHQVWLKIGIESEEVEFNYINLKTVKGPESLNLLVNGIEVSASIIRLDAFDQTGKKAIFLVVNTISPHEVYTFELQQRLSFKLPATKEHCLNCTVLSFSDEPTVSREGVTSANINFTPPEPFTPINVPLLLRRLSE